MDLESCGVTEMDETSLRVVDGGLRVRIPIGGGDPEPEPEPLV